MTIRQFADTVLVGALVSYLRADGSMIRTRYSSVYVRRLGLWRIVRVQWTRVTAP